MPLATILISLGDRWNDAPVRARVRNWYWSGVFGELYGSAIESRFARDLPKVVTWALDGETLPQTVQECNFIADRLRSSSIPPIRCLQGTARPSHAAGRRA